MGRCIGSGTELVSPEAIEELLAKARQLPAGCFVEVGVYYGGTAKHLYTLAEEQHRDLYLYDTFSGLPSVDENDIGLAAGNFCNTDYAGICQRFPQAGVIKGVFPYSAVAMPPVALVHLDCDTYKSVKESAEYLLPLMVKGGLLWFDDSPSLPGAKKATLELFGARLGISKTGKHYLVT